MRRPARLALTVTTAAALAAGLAGASAGPSLAQPAHGSGGATCPPAARALGYSDALDKLQADGHEVGGLSALAYDSRRDAYAAIEDHSDGEATRIWFLREITGAHDTPRVVGTLTLTAPDGSAYDDTSFDAEGLVVLPDGHYLATSEVEPSIHEFDRSGREVGTLPVPARFRVAPAGEATANATLEGLTISPDGRTVYAAMEGALSGDVTGSDQTFHRVLVYERGHHGYRLTRQVGYRAQAGNRISEVQAYGRDGLLVMEAAFTEGVGNTVELYAVHTGRAPDVTRVADLARQPRLVAPKRQVADVTACPTLGATSKETQKNPLLDNFEGMTIVPTGHHGHDSHGRGGYGAEPAEVVLISDDNFNATQTTRVLRLGPLLP